AGWNIRPQGAFLDGRVGAASGLLVLLAATAWCPARQYPAISDVHHCLRNLVEFPGGPFHQQHSGAVVMTIYRVFPVFSTAFALLYLVVATFNYALFTYHPMLHELDLLVQPAKAGPAMYWYGWITTAAIGAVVVAIIAAFVPDRWGSWIQRAIVFASAYAVLYVIAYALALLIYDRASYELEFLKHPATPAAAALATTVAASFFFPARWTREVWSGWCGVVSVGVMLVFVYLLRGW